MDLQLAICICPCSLSLQIKGCFVWICYERLWPGAITKLLLGPATDGLGGLVWCCLEQVLCAGLVYTRAPHSSEWVVYRDYVVFNLWENHSRPVCIALPWVQAFSKTRLLMDHGPFLLLEVTGAFFVHGFQMLAAVAPKTWPMRSQKPLRELRKLPLCPGFRPFKDSMTQMDTPQG